MLLILQNVEGTPAGRSEGDGRRGGGRSKRGAEGIASIDFEEVQVLSDAGAVSRVQCTTEKELSGISSRDTSRGNTIRHIRVYGVE